MLAVSSVGNRFLYTGREYLAEIGLYDYRNRFYSPSLGRFLQTDPIGFSAGDVNLYRYIWTDPVNGQDPMGLIGGNPGYRPVPVFNPDYWNKPDVIGKNNCYNYALDRQTNDNRQPGGGYGPTDFVDCASLKAKVMADGATEPDLSKPEKCQCPNGKHKIRLWANGRIGVSDGEFHFYRQDRDGSWSDKSGGGACRRVTDPNSYTDGHNRTHTNCGDLCVNN
jgi:RHS repeat-associated protein